MTEDERHILWQKLEAIDPDYGEPDGSICMRGWVEFDNFKGIMFQDTNDDLWHPHIYIAKLDSDESICIRLDKPKYYKHYSEKYKNSGRFTEDEIYGFIKFLESIVPDSKIHKSHWWYIAFGAFVPWFKSHKLIKLKKMPDYTKLLDED